MTIYFLIVFGAYFLLLLVLWVGWRRSSQLPNHPASKNIFISIVVAVRNEKENLEGLLQSLTRQNYPATDYEIILVDDHSNDGSKIELQRWSTLVKNLIVTSLDGPSGKKAALSLGVRSAKGDVIATTDADCVIPLNWLQKINEGFQNGDTNMLIGRVALQPEAGFFSRLQSIEFASVIGTGVALAALGKPTMCNGANLSFRRKVFEDVKGYSGNEHIASGDDEFLMRKIEERYPKSIRLLTECVVTTQPQSTLTDFVQQRLRWACKWRLNSSLFARVLALFMLIIQMSWLALLVWAIIDDSRVGALIVLFKILIDLAFLRSVCLSLKVGFRLTVFLPLQFLYPFYVLYIGIFSQVKNHEWKGRVVADLANAR